MGHTEHWIESTGYDQPNWQRISLNFPDEKDCIASFLAFETAEILWGAKPANLVNVVNRRRSCGRNLFDLWHAYGAGLIKESGLKVMELTAKSDRLLLLIYHDQALRDLLAQKKVAAVLGRTGYRQPTDLELALGELRRRMGGNTFPHEIGVFLGYPLKDVVGFLGWTRLPFSCQGPWKIFGEPGESLRLAETHRHCRSRMATLLSRCHSSREFLPALRLPYQPPPNNRDNASANPFRPD
jgi:hypothetical protein